MQNEIKDLSLEDLKESVSAMPEYTPYKSYSSDMNKYIPIFLQPYQVYVGDNGIEGNIEVCNMKENPHIIYNGQYRTGKSTALRLAVTNLLETNDDRVDLYIFEMAKYGLSQFSKHPQVKYYSKTLRDTYNGLKEVIEILKQREELLKPYIVENIADNIIDYNIYAKKEKELPIVYVVIDEANYLFAKDELDSKEQRIMREESMKIISTISQCGSSYGIYLIVSSLSLAKDLFPPFIKNNCCCSVNTTTNFNIMLDVEAKCRPLIIPRIVKDDNKKQVIKDIEVIRFQRKEKSKSEIGILINNGSGRILDGYGDVVNDVWHYYKTDDLVLRNLDLIFDREKFDKIREMEFEEYESSRKQAETVKEQGEVAEVVVADEIDMKEIPVKRVTAKDKKTTKSKSRKIGYTL